MATTMERFREVPSHSVPADELEVSRLALDCICRALGLPASIRLRWFRPLNTFDESAEACFGAPPWATFADDERIRGRMNQRDGSEIWVRSHGGPRRVALTVAHELRHVAQVSTHGFLINAADIDAHHAAIEADADDFASSAIDVLLPNLKP